MTKRRRVINIITGLLMIAAAVLLVAIGGRGIYAILLVLSIGFLLRGLQCLAYYFTMARSMVGGKSVLYRAIILLDLGLFTGSVTFTGQLIGILYVAVLNLVSGFVDILRCRDEKSLGAGQWKSTMVHGAVSIHVALAILDNGLGMHSAALAVLVYSFGLACSGVSRIMSAFRRTAIVYIQ